MEAVTSVTEEVLGACRQEALLALRRSVLPCVPIRSKRKLELIADIAPECDTPANRQRIFAEVLGTWSMHELRLFIARLKGLGYMVPVAQRPRQQDLIAAIVNAGECIAKAPIVSKRARKECDARAPAEQSGLRAEGTSQGSSSTRVMDAPEHWAMAVGELCFDANSACTARAGHRDDRVAVAVSLKPCSSAPVTRDSGVQSMASSLRAQARGFDPQVGYYPNVVAVWNLDPDYTEDSLRDVLREIDFEPRFLKDCSGGNGNGVFVLVFEEEYMAAACVLVLNDARPPDSAGVSSDVDHYLPRARTIVGPPAAVLPLRAARWHDEWWPAWLRQTWLNLISDRSGSQWADVTGMRS